MAGVPRYQAIEADLSAQIATGELAPEARLPSEHELAERYDVSRMTVRQALDRLESSRLIVRLQGSGNFVSTAQVQGRHLSSLRSFSDDLIGARRKVSTRVLRLEVVPAPQAVAEVLHLTPGQEVIHFERVRLVDGHPAALQDSWIPYSVAPGLARDGVIGGSLYLTLRQRYGVKLQWADQIMTAAELTRRQGEVLEAAAGTAVLSTRRTTFSANGKPVEFAESWTLPGYPLITKIDR